MEDATNRVVQPPHSWISSVPFCKHINYMMYCEVVAANRIFTSMNNELWNIKVFFVHMSICIIRVFPYIECQQGCFPCLGHMYYSHIRWHRVIIRIVTTSNIGTGSSKMMKDAYFPEELPLICSFLFSLCWATGKAEACEAKSKRRKEVGDWIPGSEASPASEGNPECGFEVPPQTYVRHDFVCFLSLLQLADFCRFLLFRIMLEH